MLLLKYPKPGLLILLCVVDARPQAFSASVYTKLWIRHDNMGCRVLGSLGFMKFIHQGCACGDSGFRHLEASVLLLAYFSRSRLGASFILASGEGRLGKMSIPDK